MTDDLKQQLIATPRTDTFVTCHPGVSLGVTNPEAIQSVRNLMIAWSDFARQVERENAVLREALSAALGTYRQSFKHPGVGRHDPYPIPDPQWVIQARTALSASQPKEGG